MQDSGHQGPEFEIPGKKCFTKHKLFLREYLSPDKWFLKGFLPEKEEPCSQWSS